ncbi:MAG: iron-sulfur cluster assembly scaffold protein [Sphingomonadaceae bacterium]|nr:iron-sulfur cluster assembly scaffold protein [Sphingomonadaceae bacterium]
MAALYTADILRLATDIPFQERLPDADATVEKRSPVCGSQIVVDVKLDAEGRVERLGQQVKACALGQASAALMGRNALGRSPDDLCQARDALSAYLAGERSDPGGWPGLDIFGPAVAYPARHRSICLAFEAVAEAAANAKAAY